MQVASQRSKAKLMKIIAQFILQFQIFLLPVMFKKALIRTETNFTHYIQLNCQYKLTVFSHSTNQGPQYDDSASTQSSNYTQTHPHPLQHPAHTSKETINSNENRWGC